MEQLGGGFDAFFAGDAEFAFEGFAPGGTQGGLEFGADGRGSIRGGLAGGMERTAATFGGASASKGLEIFHVQVFITCIYLIRMQYRLSAIEALGRLAKHF